MTTTFLKSFTLLAAASGVLITNETVAQAQDYKYAGIWNYDQPSASAGLNIGTIRCPATKGNGGFVLTVPQIGNLTLKKKEDGRLEGRTDQGCTWTFKDNGSSVELDPVPQSCFNKVIGSSYTMTRWSFQVDGNRQTESIDAKSHQPMGDCDFTLKQGKRTKAGDDDFAALFVGAWEYDAPDARTRSNMLQSTQQGGEQHSAPEISPQKGVVAFSKTGDHTLTARTDDGCSWLLDDHGNTAVLLSPQTCESAGSRITMNHWTIASDGEHQSSVMNMTQDAGGKIRIVLLAAGRLTKQMSR
jgi:hypothetical protein